MFNNLTDEMTEIADKMPLKELAERVLKSNKKDNGRGNRCIAGGLGYVMERNGKNKK